MTHQRGEQNVSHCEALKPNGVKCSRKAKTMIGWNRYCLTHAKQASRDPLAFHDALSRQKRGW